jgi:hypothetical protein
MISNILDTRAPHLLSKARITLGGSDHPDAYVDSCVTPPRQFVQLALYQSKGRQYRPRVWKTIEKNGGEFNPYKSESIIFFDVYMLPRRKVTFFDIEESDEDPIERPQAGERVVLKLRNARSKDHHSVKEFECEIIDVWWGRLTNTREDGFQEIRDVSSVGLIEVRVLEQFDRSLIIDSEFNLIKFNKEIAA